MGLYIPEAYGGTDMGTLAFCLAVEEIAWACASSATIYLVQYAGGWPIVAVGNEAQKRRYLPRLASGEITAAFSLSEPGAGSDAASISTRAVRKGDCYVLNGIKLWVTNGSKASVITLFATVDKGGGDRPGRARRRGGVREGAPAVRSADRRLPGRPVHAGRHGDRRARRQAPRSSRRGPGGSRGGRDGPRIIDGEVLRRRHRHEGR